MRRATRYNGDMSRLLKQGIIGGLYLAVFGALLWFGYRAVVPAPTCTDGVQNGSEDGLDCGVSACGVLCAAPVLPLTVAPAQILSAGSGSDVLVRIDNSNPLYGASRIEYTLTVSDASGAIIATRRGTTYANPAQPRYLLFSFPSPLGVGVSAKLAIDEGSVQWSALTIDAKGDIQFGVRNELFSPASASIQYQAAVLNRSKFTFDSVDVIVLVYDQRGTIVGANSTVQRTLASGESRAFSMQWPFAVAGATRVEAIISTNVFANDNFIRQYGAPDAAPGF